MFSGWSEFSIPQYFINGTSAVPDYITVTHPAGGETLNNDTAYRIYWDSNVTGDVQIGLTDNGASPVPIATVFAGAGSYEWTVPGSVPGGSNYAIRITSIDDPSVSDDSDLFSISPALAIQVISPNVNETVERGTFVPITWTTNVSGTVQVEVYKEGVLHESLDTVPANSSPYPWTIRSDYAVGADFRIRSTSTTDPSLWDESDLPFAITGADFLTLSALGNGSTWQHGSTQTIHWTSNLGGNVHIYLWKGGSFFDHIDPSAPNTGSYSWTVPATVTPGSDYQIRMASLENASIDDFSDIFSISDASNPYLTVTSPQEGATWQTGSSQTITWTSNLGGTVNLYLFRGNTPERSINPSASNANTTNSFTWTVPGDLPSSSNYRVRAVHPQKADYSPYFLVSGSSGSSPFITVTDPDGGEAVEKGFPYPIRWQDNLSENVRLWLYNGGIPDRVIVNSAPSTGSYTWAVPAGIPNGSSYRVRISSVSTDAISDLSDDDFSIVTSTNPNPDLIAEDPDLDPTYVLPGNSVLARIRVRNTGGTSAAGFRIGFYLSTNGDTWDASDQLLAWDAISGLTSGATAISERQVFIPAGTPPGFFHIIYVADDLQVVAEGNENNNVVSFPLLIVGPGADLIVENESVTPQVVVLGVPMDFSARVTNVGTTSTSGASNVGAYFSPDGPTWDPSDTFLAGQHVGFLLPDGYNDEFWNNIGLPAGTQPGTYHIVFFADRGTIIDESVETNNFAAVPIVVASPDVMIVVTPNGDETWEQGIEQTITWSTGINGTVKIELYKNGEDHALIKDDVASVSDAPNTYAWTIPPHVTLGSNYKIKISNTLFPGVHDLSDDNFTILGPPPITFTDIGAGLPDISYTSVDWGDYDDDGDLDLLFNGAITGANVTSVYRNDNGVFVNIDAGLIGADQGTAHWGDYDNDGDLDILLSGVPEVRIYRNDNGSFIPIQTGVPNGRATWGDYDNDGDLDILLGGSSRLFRNDDLIYNEVATGLPGLSLGATEWGDYDNDGDLDLVLTGWSGSAATAHIYRNDDGVFVNINAGLLGLFESSAAWGDYDDDGDLDLRIAGVDAASDTHARLYRNDNGVFQKVTELNVTGTRFGSIAWGDYDNDGDLDVVITGRLNISSTLTTTLYRNDSGVFTSYNAGFPPVYHSSTPWGDYDNDGDLDLLITGNGALSESRLMRLYRNEGVQSNTVPEAPDGLSALVVDQSVEFEWNPAMDAETQQSGLTYNLRVGTSPGSDNVVSSMSSSAGQRKVAKPGNVGHNTNWTLENLASGVTYYWSLQTVDHGFAGSAFATEQQFTMGGPPLPLLLSPGNQTDIDGKGVSLTIEAVNPAAGTTLVFSATGLPPTLSIDAASGIISGTLTNTASSGSPYAVTIEVTNGIGSDNAAFHWTVNPPELPVILTEAATDITNTSALLNGIVNANGTSTDVYFEWGTDTNYGYTTAQQAIGAGTMDVSVSDVLTDLTPGTEYHFRMVATNFSGAWYGIDVSFITDPTGGVPSVTTNTATDISLFSATVYGTVNPHGTSTNAYFEWGTDTNYGYTTAQQAIGAGTTDVSVSHTLSDLVPGIEYHFRTVAFNNAGMRYGADQVFTTAADDSWVTKAPMQYLRKGLTSSVVNGKIYAIGGWSGYYLPTVEEYDPSSDSWTTKSDMQLGRVLLTSAVVNDKIYAIGGYIGASPVSTVEEYDPATDSWTTKASMPTARYEMTAAAVNGKIYVFGGIFAQFGQVQYLDTVEEYDPATNTWTTRTSMPTPSGSPASAVVDGKIYVMGGFDGLNTVATVHVYHPTTNFWSTAASMPYPKIKFAASVVNGKIYVMGGNNDSPVREFDPVANTWTTRAPMLTFRGELAASSVNGKIYAMGGEYTPPGASTVKTTTIVEEYTPPAYLPIRFVAPTGSDTGNTCTNPANPCATIAHAASVANAGDTLSIAAGTYVELGLLIEKKLTIEGQGVIVH